MTVVVNLGSVLEGMAHVVCDLDVQNQYERSRSRSNQVHGEKSWTVGLQASLPCCAQFEPQRQPHLSEAPGLAGDVEGQILTVHNTLRLKAQGI
eukprot:1151686-Pelagomonas_calceolata.AAC.5